MRKGDLRVLARQFKCPCAGGGEKLHEELRIVSFVNIYPSIVKVTSRLFVVHKFSFRVAYKDRLLTHVGGYFKTIIITRCGLTASVSGRWVGRDNAILTEPALRHADCLKTRRLPPPHLHCTKRSAVQVWPRRTLPGIGRTLCWAFFAFARL